MAHETKTPLWEQTIQLNGKLYYEVKTFGALTGHGQQSIYKLISEGNFIRKLRAVYLADKPFIPIEELTDFPFTTTGRPDKNGKKETYHFTKEGRIKE